MKTILVLALLYFTCVLSQKAPTISEVFYAHARVHYVNTQVDITGELQWASDQPRGRGLEHFVYNGTTPEHDTFYLQRYDLGNIYTMELRQPCQTSKVEGKMPSYWGWLSQAAYKGNAQYRGQTVDIWEAAIGYAITGITVFRDRPDIVAQFWRNTPSQGNTTAEFEFFAPLTPPERIFDVPKECNATLAPFSIGGVGCVARSTMVSRAEVWVANHVPYNQAGRYNGYREDCSGYVSDIWELSRPGYTTFTLPEVSHEITKAELLAGDVLLDVQEHVVFFAGWTDSDRSHYMAYEETRPGEGTVKRATPYPYWYNTAAFKPYRSKTVC